jgi:hypothetical protein
LKVVVHTEVDSGSLIMEKEVKKVEAKTPETPTLASSEVPNDVAQEKPAVHPQETKADESKAITLAESELS